MSTSQNKESKEKQTFIDEKNYLFKRHIWYNNEDFFLHGLTYSITLFHIYYIRNTHTHIYIYIYYIYK